MKGCLLIHGYTGAPFEVEPIAKYLEKEGFRTLCPTLSGHGESRKNLRYSTYNDWIASAEEGYLKLSKYCDTIVIIGFSMGGLLAFELMQKYKAHCMISISTPIYCIDFKNLIWDILYRIKTKDYSRIFQYMESCFTPMNANLNFQKLLRKTKPSISKVNIPIFIIHGKKDPIVKYNSAEYIYNHVKSEHKEIRFYEEARHRIHDEREYKMIYEDIYGFIQKHLYLS